MTSVVSRLGNGCGVDVQALGKFESDNEFPDHALAEVPLPPCRAAVMRISSLVLSARGASSETIVRPRAASR